MSQSKGKEAKDQLKELSLEAIQVLLDQLHSDDPKVKAEAADKILKYAGIREEETPPVKIEISWKQEGEEDQKNE